MPPEAILPLGVRLDPRYEQQVIEIDDTRARLKDFDLNYKNYGKYKSLTLLSYRQFRVPVVRTGGPSGPQAVKWPLVALIWS